MGYGGFNLYRAPAFPLTSGAVWGDVVALTTLGSTSANSGSNNRSRFASPFAKAGTRIRITFMGGSAVLANVFVAPAAATGDAWDYVQGTETRITFAGGNNGITLTTSDVVSDEVTLTVPFDPNTDLIVAQDQNSGTFRYTAAGTVASYWKAGSDEAGTGDVASYNSYGGSVRQINVRRIEIFG